MAIYRLLKHRAFGPDDIKVLTAAYEDALRTLHQSIRSHDRDCCKKDNRAGATR